MNYKLEKISKIVCILSFCGFVVSLVVQMYVSNSTALKGKDFREMYAQKKDLEKEIAYLQFEESNLASLADIQKRANELGFVEMNEPLALISSPSLAALYSY